MGCSLHSVAVPTPPLVGRELDLAVALEQLKRVERGTPASLLVRGDAGIGKSRLVAELASRAQALGYPVVAGRADDLDHGIPYAVFRDLLARLGTADAGVVESSEGLRRAIDGDRAGDDEHLSVAFASAESLLRAVAGGRPAVAVLEDLHVADRESLALAALLIRLADAPVLVVVTTRLGSTGGAADIEQLCERMGYDGRGAVIDLEPLDRHETQVVVAGVLGAAPDDALVEAVYSASGGNPFFAREVGQAFADGGAVVVDGGRARLVVDAPVAELRPSTALLRRVFLGTSADIELAKVMAVFGRFPLRHLALLGRLTGLADEEVTESFDRLVKAGVLQPSETDGYEFTHSIVRTTLYEDIGPAERRRIHGEIAGALGDERGRGLALDALELATHVAASAEPGDEGAAQVLLDAAGAIRATAPLVAADYYRRAAELLVDGSPVRAEAQARRARALHVGARPGEVATVGLEALPALPPGPSRQATASLVVTAVYLGGDVEGALRVVDAELEHLDRRCPLLPMRTNLLLQAKRYADATASFADALASLDDPDVSDAAQLMALSHVAQYANHVGELDTATRLLDRVAALADTGSGTVALTAHELLAYADWRSQLVMRIEERLGRASALRPEGRTLSIGGNSESARMRVQWMRGEWDAALELARSTGFDLEQRGTKVSADVLHCAACEIYIDRGDLDAAAALADRIDPSILSVERNLALVRARIRLALGESDEARTILEGQWSDARQPGGSVWKLAEVLRELIDLHLEAGRSADAHEALVELEALADRTQWPECRLPALRARAVCDRDADAARAFLAAAEDEGWVVERARALLVLGELDIDPGPNLTEAYRGFDASGAAPWRRRAAASLRARGLSVPRRIVQATSVLTDTEVQLVRLVREGLSNRQIATAMHYSMKTIEVYLSRVYAKTECASRLELIRAVDAGAIDLGDG